MDCDTFAYPFTGNIFEILLTFYFLIKRKTMKADSFRNNRKALAALLLCTGFIAGYPLAMRAEGNEQNMQIVQQQIKVTGVVKDTTGEPVIGANVREKGDPGNGTITDIDGNFHLQVASGALLEITYIGYKSIEVKAVSGKPLNVILTEDSEMLEEVVVVGYGTMRRKDVTGSVVQSGRESWQAKLQKQFRMYCAERRA